MVDDKDAVRKALADAGSNRCPARFLDFLDPWGNRIEIVSYENVQFNQGAERAPRHGIDASVKESSLAPDALPVSLPMAL